MGLLYRVHYIDGIVVESPVPWERAPSTGVQIVVLWALDGTPTIWNGLDAYWYDGNTFGGFIDMPPFEKIARSEQAAGRLKRGSLITDEEYARIWEEAMLRADQPPIA